MIEQTKVERALEYLAHSAKQYAQAVASQHYLEEKRKIVKAVEFTKARERNITVADAENAALASPLYHASLEELKEVEYTQEEIRALRAAAEATIRLFQTQESSRRAANV